MGEYGGEGESSEEVCVIDLGREDARCYTCPKCCVHSTEWHVSRKETAAAAALVGRQVWLRAASIECDTSYARLSHTLSHGASDCRMSTRSIDRAVACSGCRPTDRPTSPSDADDGCADIIGDCKNAVARTEWVSQSVSDVVDCLHRTDSLLFPVASRTMRNLMMLPYGYSWHNAEIRFDALRSSKKERLQAYISCHPFCRPLYSPSCRRLLIIYACSFFDSQI